MATVDISLSALAICFLLLIFGVLASLLFKLRLTRPLLIAVTRMTIQLALIAVFLQYLFAWNSNLLNVLWLLIMITTAAVTTTRDSNLSLRKLFLPIFLAFFLSTLFIILYVNFLVIRIKNVFDAKYIVVLSGMLLGNILRGNIVGLTTFFKAIRKDKVIYLNMLAFGATRREAMSQPLRESMLAAFKPTIATMATMGIVALPGMMTGTILGGAAPVVAIKYQIMIMIAIFACINLSVLLALFFSIALSFNEFGILRNDIIRKEVN